MIGTRAHVGWTCLAVVARLAGMEQIGRARHITPGARARLKRRTRRTERRRLARDADAHGRRRFRGYAD